MLSNPNELANSLLFQTTPLSVLIFSNVFPTGASIDFNLLSEKPEGPCGPVGPLSPF